ncbi:heat shock protein 90-5 chloroplastic [Prunus yedoensis var. nudiflora]|uniref:Heat shock protein 90-5 chloroplastic n=1 Tax=Prunus yedoensis var. nudiflora TaxID=2094558 RepID=A0A314ZDE8_PRUYE|nr:heat shock protein 90-5 chloroplastic [Prunus yedoensis var. nudiflora]
MMAMAMALGGRWGSLEDEEAKTEVADGNAAKPSDVSAGEALETQVIEPSEVRAESDPWNDLMSSRDYPLDKHFGNILLAFTRKHKAANLLWRKCTCYGLMLLPISTVRKTIQ